MKSTVAIYMLSLYPGNQETKLKRDMERLETEKRLFDAAFKGNVGILLQLLEKDKQILDKVSLNCNNNYTPLHIATIKGHEEFVKAILAQNPALSAEIDSRKKSSPLHLASEMGHLKIVEAILHANPDMCFVFDRDGRNPFHIAAIKGKIEVLGMLIGARPFAAREKTKRGETVLNLCVKFDQLEALKILVEAMDDDEFLNQKDDDGLNILHLAVISKKIEIIQYLFTTKIDINAKNANGHTAMDIVPQNPRERQQEIENSLRQAGALKAEEITESHCTNNPGSTRANIFPAPLHIVSADYLPPESHSQMPNNILPADNVTSPINPSPKTQGVNQRSNFRWLEQKNKALMVVASLIATMAFQAGLSPPGGVWQDDFQTDGQGNPVPNPHNAGESVMAYHHLHYYKFFLRFNTTALVSSLGIILLLISELPFKHEIFMWILVAVMWLTATSIALTYGISIAFVTPKSDKEQLGHVIEVAVSTWCIVITVILLVKAAYSLHKWWKGGGKLCWPRRSQNSRLENRGNQLSRASTSFI
ncbi:hypothetical protein ACH5RR_007038 [Cinchona calisaya]|uniref:PGG domain-containing protein n=1 Tax=Cinchona calisaya TaxID=153742 RepID=A0ABD3AR38_9GENT